MTERLNKLLDEDEHEDDRKGTPDDAQAAPEAAADAAEADAEAREAGAQASGSRGAAAAGHRPRPRAGPRACGSSSATRCNVVSPLSNELGPTGPIPKSRPFRVAAIFFSGMYEYDSKFAYIALPEAQKFFSLDGAVTGLELKVDDIDATRRITRDILFKLDGYPYHTKDWGEMNRNLFAALAMEKLVMAIILGFASLPVGFLILAILMFLAFEKTKEIAVLKSMGARDQSIMKIFVLEGLIIGGVGAVLGLVGGPAGLPLHRQGRHQARPVGLLHRSAAGAHRGLAVRGGGASALLLSYLATMYPALAASRLAPVEGLRNE